MAASVLIIDDDPVFRELAERLLVAAGLDVVSQAGSVGAGMSAAKAHEPDGILLDVMLPDGNGVTPARAFAALPWQPRVVLTSSTPEAVALEEIEASGVIAFVWKNELPDAPLRRLLEGA